MIETSVGKNENDPALKLYEQMVKYQYEMNWANFVLNLRCKYNLPPNDQNIKVMSKYQWRSFVNEKIRSYAFDTLVIRCQLNSKTNHLNYKKFCQQLYITECDQQIARIIFKAKKECLMSKQILRQNTKAFYTPLFAKLMKNPWNIFVYVQIVFYENLVTMFLAIWTTL